MISLNQCCNPLNKVQLSPTYRFENWGLSVLSLPAIPSEDILQMWKYLKFLLQTWSKNPYWFASLYSWIFSCQMQLHCLQMCNQNTEKGMWMFLGLLVPSISGMLDSSSRWQSFSPWPFLKPHQILINELIASFLYIDYMTHVLLQFKR